MNLSLIVGLLLIIIGLLGAVWLGNRIYNRKKNEKAILVKNNIEDAVNNDKSN